MGSIGLGLHFISHLFAMFEHADYRSNDYVMCVLIIGWVLVSLLAALCFFKKPLYCLSSVSYVAYFVINYFTAPDFSFHAEFDATNIAYVLFGVFFTCLNSGLLIHEIRKEKAATIEPPAIEHSVSQN
jgi:membrane-bound acyltransferase YfiQ involved in biofilm formation